MGKTFTELFEKEFAKAIHNAPRQVFSTLDLPLPEEFKNFRTTLDTQEFIVEGIPTLDEGGPGFLDALNGTYVKRDPKIKPTYRVYDRYGELKDTPELKVVPTGSVTVLSDLRLDIPYKWTPEVEGYDAVEKKRSGYMYILPKKVLYKSNKTALTISTKPLKVYEGASYRLFDYSLVYISIIPFRPGATYLQTRILSIKDTLDYSEEINILVNFWLEQGILLDQVDYEGVELFHPVNQDYFDYSPVGDPMEAQNQDDSEDESSSSSSSSYSTGSDYSTINKVPPTISGSISEATDDDPIGVW